jgi:hypothetical protein
MSELVRVHMTKELLLGGITEEGGASVPLDESAFLTLATRDGLRCIFPSNRWDPVGVCIYITIGVPRLSSPWPVAPSILRRKPIHHPRS